MNSQKQFSEICRKKFESSLKKKSGAKDNDSSAETEKEDKQGGQGPADDHDMENRDIQKELDDLITPTDKNKTVTEASAAVEKEVLVPSPNAKEPEPKASSTKSPQTNYTGDTPGANPSASDQKEDAKMESPPPDEEKAPEDSKPPKPAPKKSSKVKDPDEEEKTPNPDQNKTSRKSHKLRQSQHEKTIMYAEPPRVWRPRESQQAAGPGTRYSRRNRGEEPEEQELGPEWADEEPYDYGNPVTRSRSRDRGDKKKSKESKKASD